MKFETIAGKTHVIKFSEEDFLRYIERCYNHLQLNIELAIYLNNCYSDQINKLLPFDSCDPKTIKCNHSLEFLQQFRYLEDSKKYNL